MSQTPPEQKEGVLCQHIVSTPWSQLNSDFVQQDGYGRTNAVI